MLQSDSAEALSVLLWDGKRHKFIGGAIRMEKKNNDELKNLAGENIRLIRTEKGVTQQVLSEKMTKYDVFIKPSTLSKIETGKRSITDIELAAFAAALSVEISELIKQR